MCIRDSVSVTLALQDTCAKHRWMSVLVTHVSLVVTVKTLSMDISVDVGQALLGPIVRSTSMSATVILVGMGLNA